MTLQGANVLIHCERLIQGEPPSYEGSLGRRILGNAILYCIEPQMYGNWRVKTPETSAAGEFWMREVEEDALL